MYAKMESKSRKGKSERRRGEKTKRNKKNGTKKKEIKREEMKKRKNESQGDVRKERIEETRGIVKLKGGKEGNRIGKKMVLTDHRREEDEECT